MAYISDPGKSIKKANHVQTPPTWQKRFGDFISVSVLEIYSSKTDPDPDPGRQKRNCVVT